MSVTLPNMPQEQERQLWEAYRAAGDTEARRELLDHYMPLATAIAANMYSQRADNDVEFSDYRQYAYVGLMEAIDRYDPAFEAAFSTYAGYRIKGCILNGIQTLSERKEQAAFRARVRKERVDSFIETDKATRVKQALFEEMVELTTGLALGYMLEGAGVFHDGERPSEDTTYKSSQVAELQKRLDGIVATLPERERLLIRYHYYHHMDFQHIAELLNIGKSRVSQLHKNAIMHLRRALSGASDLDSYY